MSRKIQRMSPKKLYNRNDHKPFWSYYSRIQTRELFKITGGHVLRIHKQPRSTDRAYLSQNE